MILFICNGNVARSQIAEELYKMKTKRNAQSAGTKVKLEKNGIKLIDDGEFAVNAANNFKEITGIDISNNTRKMITEELFKKAEMIIIMADKDTLPEYTKFYENKIEYWNLKDPKKYDLEGYKEIIKEINEKISKLV